MALDILTWIFAGAFAACAVTTVYLIMAFIWPMKTSPGKYFVEAKRGRKPLVILDAGKFFRFVVGDERVGDEKNQVIRKGTDIIKVSNTGGLKYAEGNVLMGIGEDFRSMITNVAIIDLMESLNKKPWDTQKVEALLKELTNNLKIDLGYVDGGEQLREKFEEDVARINAHYDAAVEALQPEVEPEPGESTRGPGKSVNPKVPRELPDSGVNNDTEDEGNGEEIPGED